MNDSNGLFLLLLFSSLQSLGLGHSSVQPDPANGIPLNNLFSMVVHSIAHPANITLPVSVVVSFAFCGVVSAGAGFDFVVLPLTTMRHCEYTHTEIFTTLKILNFLAFYLPQWIQL